MFSCYRIQQFYELCIAAIVACLSCGCFSLYSVSVSFSVTESIKYAVENSLNFHFSLSRTILPSSVHPCKSFLQERKNHSFFHKDYSFPICQSV